MIKKIIILFIFICFCIFPKSFATDEIISSQMETLNISTLIKEGQAYTKEAFPDINLNNLLSSATKGEIDNKRILKNFFYLFGKEFANTVSLIGSILIIIIIHSILKEFSENLTEKSVAQIAYYVEYILIVTLIMSNFANIVNLIKETISNLVGFITSLIPILLALIAISRKYNFNFINTTCNTLFNYFYCKYNNTIYITNNIYTSSHNHSI